MSAQSLVTLVFPMSPPMRERLNWLCEMCRIPNPFDVFTEAAKMADWILRHVDQGSPIGVTDVSGEFVNRFPYKDMLQFLKDDESVKQPVNEPRFLMSITLIGTYPELLRQIRSTFGAKSDVDAIQLVLLMYEWILVVFNSQKIVVAVCADGNLRGPDSDACRLMRALPRSVRPNLPAYLSEV